ncbi:hypothetical protein V8E36_003405 [Tilletia maclaganii]
MRLNIAIVATAIALSYTSEAVAAPNNNNAHQVQPKHERFVFARRSAGSVAAEKREPLDLPLVGGLLGGLTGSGNQQAEKREPLLSANGVPLIGGVSNTVNGGSAEKREPIDLPVVGGLLGGLTGGAAPAKERDSRLLDAPFLSGLTSGLGQLKSKSKRAPLVHVNSPLLNGLESPLSGGLTKREPLLNSLPVVGGLGKVAKIPAPATQRGLLSELPLVGDLTSGFKASKNTNSKRAPLLGPLAGVDTLAPVSGSAAADEAPASPEAQSKKTLPFAAIARDVPTPQLSKLVNTVKESTKTLTTSKDELKNLFADKKTAPKQAVIDALKMASTNLKGVTQKLSSVQLPGGGAATAEKAAARNGGMLVRVAEEALEPLTLNGVTEDLLTTLNALLDALKPGVTQILAGVLSTVADSLTPYAAKLVEAASGLLTVVEDIVRTQSLAVAPEVQPVFDKLQEIAQSLGVKLVN